MEQPTIEQATGQTGQQNALMYSKVATLQSMVSDSVPPFPLPVAACEPVFMPALILLSLMSALFIGNWLSHKLGRRNPRQTEPK